MISFFLELLVHLIITLTLVKVMFGKTSGSKEEQSRSTHWEAAADSMVLLESRLEQLTQRDIKSQERVWALEDLNRDLQTRLGVMGKNRSMVDRGPTFDDDDDDQSNSIPRNS